MPWVTAADSNIGGREEQQDRYLVINSNDGNNHLLVVADGAGGHQMGGLASQTVIQYIRDNIESLWLSHDPASYIEKLITECNKLVLVIGGSDLACTTLVLVFIKDDELFWSHVGDSRLYIIKDSKVTFQTTDHSVRELQKMPEYQGSNNNASDNELYMCLGALPEIAHSVESGIAKKDDILLLCSDGLWGQIDIKLVIDQLNESPLSNNTVTSLIEKAKQSKLEHSDNITLVAAKYVNKPNLLKRILKTLIKPFTKLK